MAHTISDQPSMGYSTTNMDTPEFELGFNFLTSRYDILGEHDLELYYFSDDVIGCQHEETSTLSTPPIVEYHDTSIQVQD